MPSDAALRLAALNDDIKAFRNYINAERGMAENTVLAYGRDLDRFSLWVADGGLPDYLDPTLRELSHYLGFLREEDLAPPSVARHLVALKMFYRFLRLEERADHDRGRIAQLAGAVGAHSAGAQPRERREAAGRAAAGDRFFLRDRALLETLYATGSRASEVVGLQAGRPAPRFGASASALGKGSKQRVVPLGEPAIDGAAGLPGGSAAAN